jgi:hypothetical protein
MRTTESIAWLQICTAQTSATLCSPARAKLQPPDFIYSRPIFVAQTFVNVSKQTSDGSGLKTVFSRPNFVASAYLPGYFGSKSR